MPNISKNHAITYTNLSKSTSLAVFFRLQNDGYTCSYSQLPITDTAGTLELVSSLARVPA